MYDMWYVYYIVLACVGTIVCCYTFKYIIPEVQLVYSVHKMYVYTFKYIIPAVQLMYSVHKLYVYTLKHIIPAVQLVYSVRKLYVYTFKYIILVVQLVYSVRKLYVYTFKYIILVVQLVYSVRKLYCKLLWRNEQVKFMQFTVPTLWPLILILCTWLQIYLVTYLHNRNSKRFCSSH